MAGPRRQLVMLESPYAGENDDERKTNYAYALRCLRDSLTRNEAPFGSHLIYPLVLDDNDPSSRDLGVRCGYAWMASADKVVFYVDRGMSAGMHSAEAKAKSLQLPIEMRRLDPVGAETAQPIKGSRRPHRWWK